MIPPRLWPTAATTIFRTFGLRGTAFRAAHELRRSTGAFRARPRHSLADVGDASGSFRVAPDALAAATDRASALARARRVAEGSFDAFRSEWRTLPASSDAWHVNPVTRHAYAAGVPWWHVPHLDPRAGDIKDIWEPARFAWVYDLVRGWLLTGDHSFVTAFADAFGCWYDANPPFQGLHWSCGQETAIRAIALLYAEANFERSAALSDSLRQQLASILAASGERIADALEYAVSQRNNHAISEAVGLVVLGARFRGVHPEADQWYQRGRRWLDRLVVEQFGPDGWFIQHSFTYLRLALDQCIIAERTLRSAGAGLSSRARARLRAATELLLSVVDGSSGIVPNHGANDGAMVHPVTLAPFRDFRPAMTAACATFDVPLPADVTADAEPLAWLGLPAPPAGAARGDFVRSGKSGWAVARIGESTVFLRAGRYSSRPGHLDALQLDVRLGGREVIVDAGTYAYNAPPPWRNPFLGARFHNGPLLDDREPGVRGPRFLWYVWPAADLRIASRADDGTATLVAEVPKRLRRTVTVTASTVTVVDQVLDPGGARQVKVRWLLHPSVDPSVVSCDPAPVMIAAAEGDPRGWFSPRYGERIPSRILEVATPAAPGASVTMQVGVRGPDAAHGDN